MGFDATLGTGDWRAERQPDSALRLTRTPRHSRRLRYVTALAPKRDRVQVHQKPQIAPAESPVTVPRLCLRISVQRNVILSVYFLSAAYLAKMDVVLLL